MKTYDKILYLEDNPEIKEKKVQVTIKYDGSNGRVSYKDGKFIFGTRKTESTNVDDLPHGLGLCFKNLASKIWNLSIEDRAELACLLEKSVLFFEVCGLDNKHRLMYPWDIDYIAFDLWTGGKYVPFDDDRFTRVLEILKMRTAEILPIDNYLDAAGWIVKQNEAEVEGVVLKDYESGNRCKILHPRYKEIESSIFGAPRGTEHYLESMFIHKNVTAARVEKLYRAIVAEKGLTGMSATKTLLEDLWVDLVDECLPLFVKETNPKKMDFEFIRKNVPKLAVPLLKKVVS